MKKSMVLSVVAGLACAGSALAQAIPGVPFEVDRSQIQQIYVNEYGEPTAPYADRAIGVVHDGLNGTATPLCAVYLNQAATPQPLVSILEDLNFSPGPWANTTNNVVRVFTVSISNSAASGTINFDLRMRFWDPANVDFTRNPMITTGATPLREIIYPVRNLGPGLFNITFTLTATGQFTVPGNRVFFQGEALQPGSTTAYFTGTQIPFWGVNPNAFVAQRGGSSNSQGFDRNRDGIFAGSATPGNTLEHSALNFAGGAVHQHEHPLPDGDPGRPARDASGDVHGPGFDHGLFDDELHDPGERGEVVPLQPARRRDGCGAALPGHRHRGVGDRGQRHGAV